MKYFSYITNSHPSFIENLYQDYQKLPKQVYPEFKQFFEGFDFAISKVKPATNGNGSATAIAGTTTSNLQKEFGVFRLIEAYRKKAHLIAKTNPIRERKDRGANLDLKFFGL